MADNITGVAIYLLPGMSVKIKSALNARNKYGYFPRTTALPTSLTRTMAKPSDLTRGFVVENTDIGEIRETDETEVAVIYEHKKASENAIWFFARTGQKTLVNIISVPIHDHSSIVQGGPAYGTYYDDSEGTT